MTADLRTRKRADIIQSSYLNQEISLSPISQTEMTYYEFMSPFVSHVAKKQFASVTLLNEHF